MSNAGVRAIGAKAIAAALCANSRLETVDLSGNDFGCRADDEPAQDEGTTELLSLGLQARNQRCSRRRAKKTNLTSLIAVDHP